MASNRVVHEVRPHTTSHQSLLAQRAIYRQGRTPVVDASGRIQPLDVKPGNADMAARHLGEIAARFGPQGLGHTIRGLDVTRGRSFTDEVLRVSPAGVRDRVPVQALGANVGLSDEPEVGGVGLRAASAIERSQLSGPLPTEIKAKLPAGIPGIDQVRIHDDGAAHTAADLLDARAFTVGRDVFLGRDEYRPSTSAGLDVLAHEVAHVAQQSDRVPVVAEHPAVASPTSAEETEADQFASAVRDGGPLPHLRSPAGGEARVMRQISFVRSNDAITTNDAGTAETATTFQIAAGAPTAPHFDWHADVTISGHAGDPFGDWQVGPHQVVRAYWLNVWWGTGANRTHRTSFVTTPIRDATAVGNTWYHDAYASANFTANGDVRNTGLDDSPGSRNLPFANPIAGRVSTRGWFNRGMAFVAYISARDTTAGTGAAAFRPLAHVYWNLSTAGDFDTARPVGSRVQVTSGGSTNAGGVIEGGNREFPTMHGGSTFNVDANANLTTT